MQLRLYTIVVTAPQAHSQPLRQSYVGLVIAIMFLKDAECAVPHHARSCIDFLVAGKVIGQSIFSRAICVGIRRPMV
jgi:hypothetical protein